MAAKEVICSTKNLVVATAYLNGCGRSSNKTPEIKKARTESLKACRAAEGTPILKLKKGGRCSHKKQEISTNKEYEFVNKRKEMRDLDDGEVEEPSALEKVMRGEEGADEETPEG